MRPFDAVIFDLDGVLADTAGAHFEAWRRLAAELGLDLPDAANGRIKGVERMAALEVVLEGAGRAFAPEEKRALADRKNGFYQAVIDRMTPADLLPGAAGALAGARRAGLKVALASASRNAPLLLDRLGIAACFDHVVDAGAVAHPKPAPDIFLAAALALGVAPSRCVGVEDSVAGLRAIRAAGMYAVGIGDPAELRLAHEVVPSVAGLDLERLLSPVPHDGT
ncbi:MAG TPA: beta-phosphoglucomutase [Azospirillaceae bacterium]|nr:beta-phosphoglucomutase [Azospirillaceae bacterium]